MEDDEVDLEEFISVLSAQVLGLHIRLLKISEPIRFTYTEIQQMDFHQRYSESHQEFHFELGLDSISSIRRLGLIEFRIAMMLSCLRIISTSSLPQIITCNEEDYNSALQISQTLKEHAKNMFSQLPKRERGNILTPERKKIYQALPNMTSRKEAVSIGEHLGISMPTVDRLLKDPKYFSKTKRGVYTKVS